VMFPVEAEDIRRRIVEEIVPTYLSDNERARILQSNGTYKRVSAGDGPGHRSQMELLALAASRGTAVDGKLGKPLVDEEFDPFAHLASGDGETKRNGIKRKKKKTSSAK
jgi:polyphosphate kinase